MNANDLTKPLIPMPRKQRRGIVLPIVAATLSGVFSGWLILFDAAADRVKPLSPTSASQPSFAESVQQASAVATNAPAMPTAKTITVTVIDSQTGAKREVVFPAPMGEFALRSTVPVTAAEKPTAGARGAPNSKAH
jgi:hypothetical protein